MLVLELNILEFTEDIISGVYGEQVALPFHYRRVYDDVYEGSFNGELFEYDVTIHMSDDCTSISGGGENRYGMFTLEGSSRVLKKTYVPGGTTVHQVLVDRFWSNSSTLSYRIDNCHRPWRRYVRRLNICRALRFAFNDRYFRLEPSILETDSVVNLDVGDMLWKTFPTMNAEDHSVFQWFLCLEDTRGHGEFDKAMQFAQKQQQETRKRLVVEETKQLRKKVEKLDREIGKLVKQWRPKVKQLYRFKTTRKDKRDLARRLQYEPRAKEVLTACVNKFPTQAMFFYDKEDPYNLTRLPDDMIGWLTYTVCSQKFS